MKYQPSGNDPELSCSGKMACASSDSPASIMADLLVNFDNNGEIFCPCFHLVSQGGLKLIIMYCGPCYHSTSLLWVPFIIPQGIVSYTRQKCKNALLMALLLRSRGGEIIA